MTNGDWRQRLARQQAVLKEGRGHLIVIASYGTGGPEPADQPYVIAGQTATMSEEFVRKHAYDLGVQNVVYGRRALEWQAAAGDDSLPGIYIDRIVLNARPEKRIEKRTITESSTQKAGA